MIGHPSETGTLRFAPKPKRRRSVSNPESKPSYTRLEMRERHPAWTAAKGFPEAPDTVQTPTEKRDLAYIQDGVHIYIAPRVRLVTTTQDSPEGLLCLILGQPARGSRHCLTQTHLEASLPRPLLLRFQISHCLFIGFWTHGSDNPTCCCMDQQEPAKLTP